MRSVNQKVDKSSGQLANQTVNQSTINESVGQSASQLVSQPISQFGGHSVSQSVTHKKVDNLVLTTDLMTLTGHRENFLRLTFSLELMLEISAAETLYGGQ